MIDSNDLMFLERSYKDVVEFLGDNVKSAKYQNWDYIVLTASNAAQAKIYELQIQERLHLGIIDSRPKYIVTPDLNDERIGSGGATLNVLAHLCQVYNIDYTKSKILLIHSGGDSKRIPQYSACGKLFSPIPRQINTESASTLFDELMASMSIIPDRMQEGLMIMSGDVLLLFNPLQIDLRQGGIKALSMKERVNIGKNHGVFSCNSDGEMNEFLHKNSVEQLQEKGAVDSFGNVSIDTGIIYFDAISVNKLASLLMTNGKIDNDKVLALINEKVRLNFYGDFIYPLGVNISKDEYLSLPPEGERCEELTDARLLLWGALSDSNMSVATLSPAQFLHFGTTAEVHNMLCNDIDKFSFLGWTQQTLSCIDNHNRASYKSICVDNTLGHSIYFENSVVKQCVVGSNSILSNVKITGVTIPEGVVVSCLKLVGDKYVARIYGINDDPKKCLKDNSLFGEQIFKLLATEGSDTAISLWQAKIYPTCDSIQHAVEMSLWLYAYIMVGDTSRLEEYKIMTKESLQSSFNNSDSLWLIQHSRILQAEIMQEKLIQILKTKGTFEQFSEMFCQNQSTELINKVEKSLLKDHSSLCRLYHFASKLIDDDKARKNYSHKFFQEIAKLCAVDIDKGLRGKKLSKSVTVAMPARVNFGGGWTDTPPYCIENGGTVLNCAVKINGQLPISVTITMLEESCLVLESKDANARKVIGSTREILDCNEPFDIVALQKCALLATGIIQDGDELQQVLGDVCNGGGMLISTQVMGIPQGSGLGTSSILSACCIKALYLAMGQSPDEEVITQKVMILEQIMSTGGGWQDQVGGIYDGIKFITSNKGVQNLRVEQLELPLKVQRELNERLVLIYTGQRRLARNLLRDIIGKYCDADADSLEALKNIEYIACKMKRELEKGDIELFSKLMREHWKYSKQLDKNCTNTCIEYICKVCETHLDSIMICGAGGGGFLQGILKKTSSKQMLADELNKIFSSDGAKVWDSEIYFG